MPHLELTSGHIRAQSKQHVLRVTLARADKRNALTRAMYEDLNRCARHADDSADVRVLLLDSEGDMFCAGNDIRDFADADPQDSGGVTFDPALALLKTLAALDMPVVIAVQGQATGIGTTLLLHSDLVVAADSARFYTAFIDLALVPEAASSLLLPRLVGRQNAARMLLAGDIIDAQEAERMGLIAYRVADAQLAERAGELAQKLAAKSPEAVRLTKQLMRTGLASDDVPAQIDREAEIFRERLFSDEVRGILQTFLNRQT